MPTELTDWLAALPVEIAKARERITSVIQKTPLYYSDFFSQLTGVNVYLKAENLQVTGSFKSRGASNKYLTIPETERDLIVTASTGNHGKAVAYITSRFKTRCKIFAPYNSKTVKLDAIRRMGADVELSGDDCVQTEQNARAFAMNQGVAYVSPYNDPAVVAGQGTIGHELCEQLDTIDAVFASVGGGGMLGGTAAAVQSIHPDCEFVACSPENSCVLIKSLESGRLLDLPSDETLSDGTAGGVEADSITFELCQKLIREHILVSEAEIAAAMKQFIDTHNMLIEGAAAVPIAALLKNPGAFQGKNVVVILCGANISFDTLANNVNPNETAGVHLSGRVNDDNGMQ